MQEQTGEVRRGGQEKQQKNKEEEKLEGREEDGIR